MGGQNMVFTTVHNENGEGNPWSALMIEAFQQHDCVAVAVSSLVEGEAVVAKVIVAGAVVVSLFDLKVGANLWSPVSKYAIGVPEWARRLSTDMCVAVTSRCVEFEMRRMSTARQIVRTCSLDSAGTGPVSQLPKAGLKKRGRAWRSTFSQWPAPFWRR